MGEQNIRYGRKARRDVRINIQSNGAVEGSSDIRIYFIRG